MNPIGLAVLLYLIVFLAVAMVWRSWLVWRRTGINPYRLANGDNPYDYVGWWFKIVIAGIGLVAVLATFFPDLAQYLEIRSWPPHRATTIAGFVLLGIALIWIVIAQAQMGASWRVGIDTEHSTPLVRTGLFRYSRNPIFLGMRVCLLGLLLILPNAASLAFCLLGEVLMQIQVRLEEEHLRRLHGQAYLDYCAAIRRWL